MPELAEVETLARDLRCLLLDAEFSRIEVFWQGSVAVPSAAELASHLPGRKVLNVGRRGKFLILSLTGPTYLLVHLRMSGRLHVGDGTGAPDPYARVVFHLTDGRRLTFADVRKFGRIYWTAELESIVGDLGPEPLEDAFTPDVLSEILSRHRGALKPLLLNQRVLAGLGNIYVDEALYAAGLHPLRKANSISSRETKRLHTGIQRILREAIRNRGTTLDDASFHDAEGQPGLNASNLQVYQRAGEPCVRCGTLVERTVVGGRGTHLCPGCQQPEHSSQPDLANGQLPDMEHADGP